MMKTHKRTHQMIRGMVFGLVLLLSVRGWAERVSLEQARVAAENWLKQSSDRLGTSLDPVISYVQDYESFFVAQLDPEGFIVLSADSLVPPVIAFTGQGTFSLDEESPLVSMLSVDMPERLSVADTLSALPGPPDDAGLAEGYQAAQQANTLWGNLLNGTMPEDGTSSISDVRIAPFVSSEWNQGSAQGYDCYNYYTPNNYVAGCVAIAMAQVIRYYEYPTAGVGLYTNTIYVSSASQTAVTRGGDGSGGAYNYSLMPLEPGTASYDAAQWRMIGALCYDCGVACKMNYGSSGSSAYYSYARDGMLDVFNFSSIKYTYSSSGVTAANRQKSILPNLAARCPIMLGVRRTGGGHAVVCDGWGYSSSTEYHHINLGWGGYYNAWYNLPTIDAGSYVYTMVDTVLYNVFTNGTDELIAGRITDNSGTAVDGAVVTATGGYTASSDAKGYYAVRVPASSTYNLTVEKTGYASGSRNSVTVGSSGYNVGNYWGADMTLTKYDFSFKTFALTNNVVLRWTNPLESGMTCSTAMVRRSTADYPASIGDGTEIYTGTNVVVTDNGLTPGQTYYYTIWVNDGVNWTNPPSD